MTIMEEGLQVLPGGGRGRGRSSQMPPGFRFQPTDQEIIVCYLKKKMAGTATSVTSIIADVDIYKFDPWDLPDRAADKAIVCGDGEWFFFSPRERKYPKGCRPNRTAGSGYWKATGTDKPILAGNAHCLGVKKALVFYQGRSPKGTKTEWVMDEYRLLDTDHILLPMKEKEKDSNSMRLDDWVLCRVRNKQLGAFIDHHAMEDHEISSSSSAKRKTVEDWSDDQLLQYLIGGGSDDLARPMSNKRQNSFQAAMDDHHELELYHLQPNKNKRPNIMSTPVRDDHQQTSFSISETDDFFF